MPSADYPNTTATQGGPSPYLFINETGCSIETGEFDVLEIETSGESVTALAIDFAFRCGPGEPIRSGEYRFNSTIDLAGPDLAPRVDHTFNRIQFPDMLAGTVSGPETVTLTNNGTAALAVSDVALSGPAPEFFEIVGDSCDDVTIDPGGTCTVVVRAAPPLAGGHGEAFLTFAADSVRTTFGVLLTATGLTTTSLEITSPDVVVATRDTELRARISPANDTTFHGMVDFLVDDVSVGQGWTDVNGDAVVTTRLSLGSHSVHAIYQPPCCPDPAPSQAEAIKTITALNPVDIAFVGGSPPFVPEGTAVQFNVTLETTSTPASGTLRIRNATAGTTLAQTTVTGPSISLSTPAVVLPVGNTEIVAEFVGDPTYAQTSVTRVQTVTKDTTVDAGSLRASPAKFYPSVDGYKDTVKISGTTLEPATVTVRIYNSHGAWVRTLHRAVGTAPTRSPGTVGSRPALHSQPARTKSGKPS